MLNDNLKIETTNTLLKDFVKKALAIKHIYIATVLTFMVVAFFINKYSHTIYQVQAKLLIRKNESNGDLEKIFRSSASLMKPNNIENEVNLLKSYSLVGSTIKSLNLEIGYFSEKKALLDNTPFENLFKSTDIELYTDFPFTMVFDKSHYQPTDLKLYIEILTDSTYKLTGEKEKVFLINYLDEKYSEDAINLKINKVYKFNETVETEHYKFTVSVKDKKNVKFLKDNRDKYYFKFYYSDYLTMNYLNSIQVQPLSDLASIIFVSIEGVNKKRINNFMNKYLELYMENSLERRNMIAQSTIDFIDNQISDITDSLKLTENKLLNHRSSNQVVDMSFQGQRIFDQMGQIESQKQNMLAQKRYYTYILDYLKSNDTNTDPVLPSSSNVVDPILNQLIMELTDLNGQKNEILNGTKKNLFINQIENKIDKQKEIIYENVSNNLNTLNISINEIDYRHNKMSREISQLPKTELKLVGINREYKLNDAIYTFLLQRRAEAQISKASNLPESEIVEPAREIATYITYPNKNINYIISIFIALMLPTIFILLKDFFNDRVNSSLLLSRIVEQPVLSTIYRNKYKVDNIVLEQSKSYVAESFRTLRTLIFAKMKGVDNKTILVTSSIPAEGKSFVAINLASSLSVLGNKTIIIDCDLRKPTLHNKLKVANERGLTNYFAGESKIEDIIIKIADNLFFIPAYPVLPNPSELLDSQLADEVFEYLKLNFKYIVIDTPPVGAISDSLLLTKHSGLVLFVSRCNYTKKDVIYYAKNKLIENDVKNLQVILNDVDFSKNEYGAYYKKYYSAT
ncbi:MAG: polysaccharide biosynthesis tyrosine autokinase [Bacteroidales bacterium]|nr:polysaccharide biosynthesis tyrosine autokinase [Bacteroidales bacterium]